MTTITIRNVPEDVRNELAARAARQRRSLQEFMLGEIVRLAEKPPISDLVAEVAARKARNPYHIGREAILADRDADRR